MTESFMSYHPDPYVRNYSDRGMAKWLGFYLSEHTSEMDKDKLGRDAVWLRREQMSELEIGSVLETAYVTREVVKIQMAILNMEGQALPDVVGTIEGFGNQEIYLSDMNGELQVVFLGSINHISLLTTNKWSDVS